MGGTGHAGEGHEGICAIGHEAQATRKDMTAQGEQKTWKASTL